VRNRSHRGNDGDRRDRGGGHLRGRCREERWRVGRLFLDDRSRFDFPCRGEGSSETLGLVVPYFGGLTAIAVVRSHRETLTLRAVTRKRVASFHEGLKQLTIS